MPGRQRPQRCRRIDQLAGSDQCLDRLVAGVQTTGMGQRHHRPAGDHTREHHGRRSGGVDGLSDGAGQVDAAVARVPVRRRGVEVPQHRRGWAKRPDQPRPVVGMGGCGAGPDDDQHDYYSHTPSSAIIRRTGQPGGPVLGTARPVWTKHPFPGCKLISATRLKRVDFARLPRPRSYKVAPAVPGGPGSRKRPGPARSGRQGSASPDAERQPTMKAGQNHGCSDHEAAA